MKHLFIALFFIYFLCPASGQNNIVKTAGVSYTAGVPTFSPGRTGSQVAIDTVTGFWYEHNGTSWSASGYRVQTISGCSAPAYTPAKYQSRLVINACTAGQGGPELYYWTGSVWLQINEGQTYTAGTGIDISGGVISNTGIDRFAFSASAPSDTNRFWVKPSLSKIDTIFSYESRWRQNGFFDRVTNFWSQKPPLFVVATGQSNMLGLGIGGDTTSDARVVVWDTLANIWRRATIGLEPFNSIGANNLAFQFCKRVAEEENRTVRLILYAQPGRKIENWFGVGGYAYNINMNVHEAKMPRADVLLWHQGESNGNGQALCHDNTCYVDSLKQIRRQFLGYDWADESTLFIAGGLSDILPTAYFGRTSALYSLNTDTIYTTGFASAAGLSTAADSIHFLGSSLVTLGREQYYNTYRALPQLYVPSSAVLSQPTAQIVYGSGSGITSDALFVRSSGKVGIQTAIPLQELHVVGDILANSLRLNGAGDSAILNLKYSATQSNSSPVLSAWNNAGSLRFWSIHRTVTGNNFVVGNGLSSVTGVQNQAYGVNGLYSITSGSNNLANGYRSLENLTTGYYNISNGSLSLIALVDGFSNIMNGYGAGATLTSGYQNIGNGTQVFSNVSATASGNIGNGNQAFQNLIGNNNVGNGSLVGQNLVGSNNVLEGASTGRNLTGSNNVYIGPNQSFTITESDILRIENSNTTTPLIGADFANNRVSINTAPGSIAASSIFEITSTTQGVLLPRMTSTQRDAISSPSTGLTLYCTDCTATDASTGVMQTYNGTAWKNNW